MAKVFAKDTYVWLADETDGFVPAKVLATFSAGEKGTVENLVTDSKYTLKVSESEALLPMDQQSLEPIADMVQLKQLDEPALLHNLRLRYKNDDIYTSIGSILVSVNPFKKLNIYSPEVIDQYIQRGGKQSPPHIFATADNAYENLVDTKASQSCIVSGESGAGKTEATKLFLQYLAEKSSAGDENAKSGASVLHEKILEANPVMEAFGNAKTVRNNNSSRFGKLIQVDFDNKRGKIIGGNITSYLLEKSRIVGQNEGERNYHIFYQLCTFASLDPDFNQELNLLDASAYYYTNPTDDESAITVDGLNDSNEFESTKNAMDVLEFSKQQQDALLKTLAGILNLGNVTFEPVEEHSLITSTTQDYLMKAAGFLGIDAGALGSALIKRKVREFFQEHTVAEATAARDAFAKAVYGYMFDWIIERINASLVKQAKISKHHMSSISVLDIFGFESFEINSFEQLCINYCNEKLQSHFNEHIFALEQKLYAEEGIDLKRIEFADNQPTLDAIEAKDGVLAILDEVCKMRRGNDKIFLTKVHNVCDDKILKKPDVKMMRDTRNEVVFSVVHYAGEVHYTVTNFLDKNRDRLLEDLGALGAASKSKFIREIFSKKTKTDSNKTLGNQFKAQLAQLMETLSTTEPHYVRTMKPNNDKAANDYQADLILDQMRYAGLMEVCRIRKLGFPVRREFAEFYKRYKPLASDLVGVKDHVMLCKDLETQNILNPKNFAIGKTKVFMRDNEFNELEISRANVLGKVATKIERVVRGFIARRRFKKYKQVLAGLEAATASRDVEKLEQALRQIGILPYVGKHLKEVQKAKKELAIIKEELRVLGMVDAALKSRNINSLNSAIAAAEKLNLTTHEKVQEAINLKELVLQEKKAMENLEAALELQEIDALKKAIVEADALDLKKVNAYQDAIVALKRLQAIKATVELLDEAVESKNVEEIIKHLSKMVELGMRDHPSVAKGQEITKEIAKASEEAERQMKKLTKDLETAIRREDLAALKKLRPQVLQFGITGEVVDNANSLIQKLEKKARHFSELTAAKQALEVKATSYNGVPKEDVDLFSRLIDAAKDFGFHTDDEELGAMRDYEEKMRSQLEAQDYLLTVVKSKDETELRKALGMIQDLGLEIGIAKEIEQEVQILDTKKLEVTAAERVKEKEELKKNLKEANEDDREDEKQALLEERTDAHKELIAKASDSSKYAFSKYYKIREDGDYVGGLPTDKHKIFADHKLKYQTILIPKSIMQFPTEENKTALLVHKGILQYCGDMASTYPNTLARFMIVTSLENPVLVDEIYLQLMKHLTENYKAVSEDRGWGLMCMLTMSVPPTTDFAPFVVNFLLQHKHVAGLIGNYAKLCTVQLDGRIRLGPTKLLPDLEVVDAYSQRPPILAVVHRIGEGLEPMEVPVTPDEDVDRVLADTIFLKLDIDEDMQNLYGLFVIDGRPDTDLDLKTRLTRFYQRYNPSKLAHVDYFVDAWGENIEGLFHKLETKYGPEPTAEEVAEVMRKRGRGDRANFLRLPITAAYKAMKNLGLTSGPREPPPPPQTAWPIPWWVYLGDVLLRMVKQNRVPIFTFKRKLFINGESISKELIEQNRYDVIKGDLAIQTMEDVVHLAAIHLTLRNGGKIPTDEQQLITLGLVDALPVSWLATKQPKEFIKGIMEVFPKLEGASVETLDEKYLEICRKQIGYGMWYFYLSGSKGVKVEVAGVDTSGVHIMDEAKSIVKKTYNYRKIKEYGAGPTQFWMKVVEKDENGRSRENMVTLNTIQAWDLYGLVHDYTFNAEKLKLK